MPTSLKAMAITLLCTLLSQAVVSARAQEAKGLGFVMEGFDYRSDDGHLFDKRFDKVFLRFGPLNNDPKTVNFSGEVAVYGDNASVFLVHCPEEARHLPYRSSGPVHLAIECPEPTTNCVGGTCLKNPHRSTTVTIDTMFSRNGRSWSLKGVSKTVVVGTGTAPLIRTHVLTETADIQVDAAGCAVRSYLSTSELEESYDHPGPFDHPAPKTVNIKRSGANTTCSVYVR